jgi:class 3 adenylate cyclase
MQTNSLLAIIAYARAGALDFAWAQFRAGGFDMLDSDPAALSVKGRLLKDRALLASGKERRSLLIDAAAAYARADAIDPQPYPLINVATLSFLAGAQIGAAKLAREVIERLDSGKELAETPYYIAATRAEALLLLGDVAAADTALGEAIDCYKDGWPDHASTLRQLALILESAAMKSAWLDKYRPPRSLHYAGHLGIAADAEASRALRERIDSMIERERIGFGYGALAAGSDIMIAESVIAHGGALHVVLPTPLAAFRAQSVEPYGAEWTRRFEACVAAAASLREATHVEGGYEPLATSLSSEIAMGAAALNARMLESEAVQLLITDEGAGPYGSGAMTARDGTLWEASGRRQETICWPRNAPVVASGNKGIPESAPDRRLAAMLYADVANFELLDEQQIPIFLHHVLKRLAAAVESGPVSPFAVKSWGQGLVIAFETVDAAADCAVALQKAFAGLDLTGLGLPVSLALKICGHYGLVHTAFDPFAGQQGLFGSSATLAARMEPVTAPGAVYVSEDFVSALFARGRFAHRAEYVGDHLPLRSSEEYRLFALKAG